MRIHPVLPFALATVTGCTVGATVPTPSYFTAGYSVSGGGGDGEYVSAPPAAPQGSESQPIAGDDTAQLSCVHDTAGKDFASAGPIGAGTHFGCVVGKQEVYVVTAPETAGGGALYTMKIIADKQICLGVYDQDRQKQGTACSDDLEPRAFWAAVAPGTQLYLRLERSLSYQSPYRLDIEARELDDPDEPNDGIKSAVALEPGDTHQALMQRVLNDDNLAGDVYVVDVDRSGTLSFVVDPGSDDTTAGVEIFDRDRHKLDQAWADNEGAVLRDRITVKPGRYYLRVAELHSTAAAGASTTINEAPSGHYFKPYSISIDVDGKKGKRVARR
jgi:hypothetical protein